ncbi:MAG: HAD family hydrolase [Planktomarina sp.]
MGIIKTVALDADDTLWQNEEFFRLTQDRFADLLAPYMAPDPLHLRLLAAERKNIGRYGYGIKGFMLSMIETAIEVSEGRVPAPVISEILAMGQDMLAHPIHLLDGVADGVVWLAERYQVVLITKGDLLHQEQKVAASGLGDHFDQVHIVSEKTTQTYHNIIDDPASAVMVGNSMKSDIVPALAAGMHAIHIPARYEWALELAETPAQNSRFHTAKSFTNVAHILTNLS